MQTVSTSGNISAFHRAAYSPLGDRVWLAINHVRRSFTGQTEMAPCQGTQFNDDGLPINLCRAFTFEEHSQGVAVYAIGIPDGSRSLLWKDPSATAFWIGVSEGGIEEVAGLGVIRSTSRVTFVPLPFNPSFYILQTGGGPNHLELPPRVPRCRHRRGRAHPERQCLLVGHRHGHTCSAAAASGRVGQALLGAHALVAAERTPLRRVLPVS